MCRTFSKSITISKNFLEIFAGEPDAFKHGNMSGAAPYMSDHISQATATVLIVAGNEDDNVARVHDELISRGATVWIWDVGGFPHASPFSIHFDPAAEPVVRGVLSLPAGELSLETVTAVWMRREMLGLFAPHDQPDDVGVFLGFEFEAAFRGLTDVLRNARWVNPPAALYAIEPTLAQESAARAAGLQISPEEGRPASMQVLVVGERLFAFESQASEEYRMAQLPGEVCEVCRRLVQEAGLVFASIQLAKSAGGELEFLSLNANPTWIALEKGSSQPVTSAVADLLMGTSLR